MRKIFRRAVSLLTVMALLTTCVISGSGNINVTAAESVTSAIASKEWLYDFKSGTGNDGAISAYFKQNQHDYYGGTQPLRDMVNYMSESESGYSGAPTTYVDWNGLHYYSYLNKDANSNSAYLNFNGDAWSKGFTLWDADYARAMGTAKTFSEGLWERDNSVRNTFPDTETDANLYPSWGMDYGNCLENAGLVAIEDGTYEVTVTYRVPEMNTATNRIDIAMFICNPKINDGDMASTGYIIDFVTVTDITYEWVTAKFIVQGDKYKGTGYNYLKIAISNDVYTDDKTYNLIEIKNVNVKYFTYVSDQWVYDFKYGTDTESTADDEVAYLKQSTNKDGVNDLEKWLTNGNDGQTLYNGPKTNFDKNGLHYYSDDNTHDANYSGVYTNTDKAPETNRHGFVLWDADIAKNIPGARSFSDGNWEGGIKRNTFPNVEGDRNLYVTYGLDSDANYTQNAGLKTIEDGIYAVTVKFKVVSMNTGTSRVDIGVGVRDSVTEATGNYTISGAVKSFDSTTVWQPMTEYATYTAFVDGSLYKGNGDNFFEISVSNSGTYQNDGTYNQIDFESVVVRRYYDYQNDETGVRYQAPTDSASRNFDVPGTTPVLASANSAITLANYDDGSTTNEFYRWMPYNAANGTHNVYQPVISKYNVPTDSQANAKLVMSTYAGASVVLGKGLFGLRPQMETAVAAPTDTNVYTLDTAGMIANKSALAINAQDGFMSQSIEDTLTASSDGTGIKFAGTNGDWFYGQENYEYIGSQRLGFYSLSTNGDVGNFAHRGIKLKNGYTYEFEMTYKVELNDPNKTSGTSVVIGVGVPIIRANYWDWSEINAFDSWQTLGNTDGYVTVKTRFDGNIFNEGHFLCIPVSCNSNYVTIKSASVTETFKGTVDFEGASAIVGNSLPTASSVVNGNQIKGYYLDEAKTVPVTEFNSKVRNVYADYTKVFDYAGNNGYIVTEKTADGLKINVKPEFGYKLSAGGVNVTSTDSRSRVFFKGDAADKTGYGTGLCFITKGIDVNDITAVSANFVEQDAENLALVAVSVKEPSGSGENYQGAGIRFRGRVLLNSDVRKVGFLLTPTSLLQGSELTLTTPVRMIKTETEYNGNTIYDETGEYKDFQVLLTNLITEDGSFDWTNTEISCVMYVVKSDNSVIYSARKAATYGAVTAKISTSNISYVKNSASAYRIVKPASVEQAVSTEIDQLKSQMNSKLGVTPSVNIDSAVSGNVPEILVGDTNRIESQAAKQMLRQQNGRSEAYIIVSINDSIVIYGNSTQATVNAVKYFYNNYIGSKAVSGGINYIFKDSGKYSSLTIGQNIDMFDYVIVRPKYNVSYITVLEIEKLMTTLSEQYGYEVKLVKDNEATAAEREIIVGAADREGVETIIEGDVVSVKLKENKIYLNGGSTYSVAAAVTEFNRLLTSGEGAVLTDNLVDVTDYDTVSEVIDTSTSYKANFRDAFDTPLAPTRDAGQWNNFNDYNQYGQNDKWAKRAKEDYSNLIFEDGKFITQFAEDENAYYGSMLTTQNKMVFKYGYFEISSIMPNGDAFWTSLWTRPAFATESYWTEIDVSENFGAIEYSRGNCIPWLTTEGHNNGYTNQGTSMGTDNYFNGEDLYTTYHTYGCEWTDTYIAFYRDGELMKKYDYSAAGGLNENVVMGLKNQYCYLIVGAIAGSDNLKNEQITNVTADQWANSSRYYVDDVVVYQVDGQDMQFNYQNYGYTTNMYYND